MIINIDKNKNNEKGQARISLCTRAKSILYYISFAKIVTSTLSATFIFLLFYLCKKYIRTVLLWLEGQDSVIVAATILVLFVIVSFPITIGYILLVTASGYLFDIVNGLLLSVIGANVGLLAAHNVIKLIGHQTRIKNFMDLDIAKAIASVISGPLSFKIVLCTRVTPIPFGLQNTIFAVSSLIAELCWFKLNFVFCS